MTMNEADADTRHEYDGYMLETLQLEYERTCEIRDIMQAQNVCDEHTSPHATQVAAAGMMTNDVDDVKPPAKQTDRPFAFCSTCGKPIRECNCDVHDVGDVRGWGMGRGLGRAEWYKTGVVAPDGGEEVACVRLCWRCDQEAEYAGYCEPHYEQWLQEQAEDEMQEHDEWLDDLWDAEELERIQQLEEERRDDH